MAGVKAGEAPGAGEATGATGAGGGGVVVLLGARAGFIVVGEGVAFFSSPGVFSAGADKARRKS